MVREQRNYNAKTKLFQRRNKAFLTQKQSFSDAKTKQLLHEKSKKEGQCPRGNCPFAL